MFVTLCKMLAPILAFTADEAWAFVPGRKVDSAHQLTWQPPEFQRPESEQDAWKALFELRELALPELEKARQAKQIGKALEAKLTFAGSSPALTAAQADLESLRELLNVSQLEIQPGGEGAATVLVGKAAGQKCERCWHWEPEVGSIPEHPTICGRCVKAVQESTRAL
jgi:isoleucyl-tRNA synthetase